MMGLVQLLEGGLAMGAHGDLSGVSKQLSATHLFPKWKGRHRFFLPLGKLPFQHRPDEATRRVSLSFQFIELDFEIHG